MESEWVDFREIKSAVSLEMVLAHYNVPLRRVNRDSLRGSCPLPTHSSKGEQSFCVNVTKSIWSCQSASCVKARHGRKGGNVLDFTALMEGSTIRDAALKLANWFNVPNGGAPPPEKKVQPDASEQLVAERKRGEGEVINICTGESVENKPLGFVLKIDHSPHPYLTARSITPETALHFGVGYFYGRGSMHNRIVIPIHNRAGELVAYAGRAIDETEPKYKFPSGFHKIELWNLHRVLALDEKGRRRVILVEGCFDAMKLHQAGYPHVVALMGSSMSERQEDLLVSHFKGIVLALDGDEAGKRATDEIALRLARRIFVRIASIPDGRQPDELSEGELKTILGSL
jgi:DNA primase